MNNFSTLQKTSLQSIQAVRAAREEARPPAVQLNWKVEKEETISEVLSKFEDPSKGWESYKVRKILVEENLRWILGLADWKIYLTLTFRDDKSPDVAKSLFKWFVRKNNEHAFGKHYTEKVGHSYFSYVVGMEYQRREVIHFHALVNKPLDFEYVHKIWGDRCGFAWIDGKIKDQVRAVGYVCKYTIKGGEIDTYISKKDCKPKVIPHWWKDGSNNPSRVAQGAFFALGDLRSP